jgi:ABC-type branched-subunit amino acid transport system substrate-binding protein
MMKLFSTSCAAILAAGAALAADPGVTDTEIKIGDVNILTGPASFIGRAVSIGSKVAAAEINAAGGINGRKIVMVTEDDGYVPSRSFQALKKLIEVDNIFALNGTSGSANILAMMPLIEENKLPTVVTTTPNELVYTPVRPSVFTIGATYQDSFYAQTRYIHENFRQSGGTYGIIRQDDEFGAAVEGGYDRAVKELNLKDAIRLRYKRGQTNFSAEVLQLRAAGVNALVNGAIIAGAANVLSEARKLNMDLAVASVWSENMPAAVRLSQPANYPYIVADYVALNDPATERFAEKVKKISPDDVAGINRYSYITYAGLKVLAKAMEACGKDLTRACTSAELRKISKFETDGLTAPISFNNEQQLSGRELKIYQLDPKAGTFKTLVDFKRY